MRNENKLRNKHYNGSFFSTFKENKEFGVSKLTKLKTKINVIQLNLSKNTPFSFPISQEDSALIEFSQRSYSRQCAF